ncbi:MAG: hypothetical protein ACREPL_09725, partial [Rhodanobacteraceae bacterium]
GVQQAQEHGIRVHLLGIEPKDPSGNQSAALQREADTRHQLDAATLGQFLFRREYANVPVAEAEAGIAGADTVHNLARMQELAGEYAATLDADRRALILALPERTPLPHELDRELLLRAGELLGRKLEESEKRTLRAALRGAVIQGP